ncbi:7-carboxy-7-deazaguanine synthase QueE [Longimonas sp.]|uniref:7-carboxy-7-deazaguanine synthase QueE n=1 Tax=Longimonas sp. TaxID=2039626 RepID=UPI003975A4EA
MEDRSVDARPVALPDATRVSSPDPEPTYRVKNIFPTVQGEGFWAGRPAVFVRLVGCNMWSGYEADRERDAQRTGADCPRWCDTDFTKEGSTAYTAAELTQQMRDFGGPIDFCVLTGGEPFLQADAALIQAMHKAGYTVAIETNGTVALEEAFADPETDEITAPDWITCSPKLPEEHLTLERFDELKLVVPDYRPAHYERFARRGTRHTIAGETRCCLYVQPEDGPRLQEAQKEAVALATQHPEWSVSTQTHKVLDVD